MIFTFFANLTFSLFMETEVFVWTLIVTIMVISTQKRDEIHKDQYDKKERHAAAYF